MHRTIRRAVTAALTLSMSACTLLPNARRPRELIPFLDTERPNALWTLPLYDERSRPFSLEDTQLQEFLAGLETRYDVRLVRAGSERAVYRALDTTPDLALWVLSGHGNGDAVLLNRCIRYCDNARLDAFDAELSSHVENLLPDAIVYLDSCFGGVGREQGNNVANRVATATGRSVYSSDTFITWGGLTVTSWYPFSMMVEGIEVTADRRWILRDATYIARP